MQAEIIHEEVMEEILSPIDSLSVLDLGTLVANEVPGHSLVDSFVNGGLGGMIIITLLLIALLVAAWKAPRWVKEIGIGALVFSIFWMLCGVFQSCDAVQMTGDASPRILAGAMKVTLIPLFYGLIVYFISLIIRIIHKPRI